MRCLLVMHIWTMSPDLSQGVQIPHHAQDSLPVDIPAFRPQYPLTDTAEAVSEFAFCLALHNPVLKSLVVRWGILTFPPCVISAPRDFHYTTHSIDRILFTETFNDTIFEFHLLPTSDRKFLSSSTCIRRVASSFWQADSEFDDLRGRPLPLGT